MIRICDVINIISHTNSNESQFEPKIIINTHRSVCFAQIVRKILLFHEISLIICEEYWRISMTLRRFCRKNEYRSIDIMNQLTDVIQLVSTSTISRAKNVLVVKHEPIITRPRHRTTFSQESISSLLYYRN